MLEVSYVYPNLSQVYLKSKTSRGGLSERWALAQETGCGYFEIAGTLIKNKTEERLTSLDIGDFLSQKEISILYNQDDEIQEGLKYILHTEPSLSKPNRYGRKVTSPINWHDKSWSSRYLEMILAISNYLHHPPSVIEIHPGYRDNTFEDVALFTEMILDAYQNEYGETPLILLENRTEQFISTGKDIKDYWEYVENQCPDIMENTGIVLDIQQLFTKTKGRFLEEFLLIPEDCLKAFHIHTKHKWPKLSDEIPWKFVLGRIKDLSGKILINPEIHQKNRVQQVINFCNNILLPKNPVSDLNA